jgi:hypothetical protein
MKAGQMLIQPNNIQCNKPFSALTVHKYTNADTEKAEEKHLRLQLKR